jgi:hypothetical protein
VLTIKHRFQNRWIYIYMRIANDCIRYLAKIFYESLFLAHQLCHCKAFIKAQSMHMDEPISKPSLSRSRPMGMRLFLHRQFLDRSTKSSEGVEYSMRKFEQQLVHSTWPLCCKMILRSVNSINAHFGG